MSLGPHTDASEHYPFLNHTEQRVFQAVYERLNSINIDTSTLATRAQGIEQRASNIENRLSSCEARLSNIEGELVEIKSDLREIKELLQEGFSSKTSGT